VEFNGIRLDVSQQDFFKQDAKTRDWMMFSAVAGLAHQMNDIKEHGCSWARNYTRKRSWRDMLVILGVASMFGIVGWAAAVFAVTKIWP